MNLCEKIQILLGEQTTIKTQIAIVRERATRKTHCVACRRRYQQMINRLDRQFGNVNDRLSEAVKRFNAIRGN